MLPLLGKGGGDVFHHHFWACFADLFTMPIQEYNVCRSRLLGRILILLLANKHVRKHRDAASIIIAEQVHG